MEPLEQCIELLKNELKAAKSKDAPIEAYRVEYSEEDFDGYLTEWINVSINVMEDCEWPIEDYLELRRKLAEVARSNPCELPVLVSLASIEPAVAS